MLQHLVKHLAKRCFMQNVANLQKRNNLPLWQILAKTSSWETSCDLSFRSSWIRSGEGTQSGKVNFQIVTSSENYFTHGISKIVLQIVTSSEEQFG